MEVLDFGFFVGDVIIEVGLPWAQTPRANFLTQVLLKNRR